MRVRLLQGLLGATYASLALVALTRSPGLATLVVAVGALLLSHLTARTIPDAVVPTDAVPNVCAIGLAVVGCGLAGEIFGGPHAQEAVAIIMAYCAGNRLKAAGVGLIP